MGSLLSVKPNICDLKGSKMNVKIQLGTALWAERFADLLTPVQITSFEETFRDVTPPSAGEEEETTWDLRLGGRAEPHREDTNCYLLLLTWLWWEASEYSMNTEQAHHVGSSASGDLRFRILALSRSWDVRSAITSAVSRHFPSQAHDIYWRRHHHQHPQIFLWACNILKSTAM